jgi:hypothetical protein
MRFIYSKLDNVRGLIEPASSNPLNLSTLILKNQISLHQPTSILCAFSCLISESGDKCIAIAAEVSELAENPGAEILLRTTGRTAQETVELVRGFWERLGFQPQFEPDPSEQAL